MSSGPLRTCTTSLLVVGAAACELMTDFDGLVSVASVAADASARDAGDTPGARDAGESPAGLDAADAYVAFDAADAAVARSNVRVLQSVMTSSYGAATLAPTKAGSLIAVVFSYTNAGANPSITDDADGGSSVYVPTVQAVAVENGGNLCGFGEIRFARNVPAGVKSVQLNWFNGMATGWVLEIAGVNPSSTVVSAKIDSQPPSAAVAAPAVVPSVPATLVLSEALGCVEITNVRASSPFVGLLIQGGDDAAYLVTNGAGSYGAVWDVTNTSGTWAALTVAF